MTAWRALNLTVSTEAHDGWRHFCAAHGTTMTALAEAIGLTMAKLDDPESELPPHMQSTLVESRRIAAARASRS